VSDDSACERRTGELFSRRSFGHLAAVAVGAAAAGFAITPAADASPILLTLKDEDVVLKLAHAIATLPVEFPAFGEGGTASSRVTRDRLRTAAATLTSERVSQLRRGIATISAVDPVSSSAERLVTQVGAVVRRGGVDDGLLPVTALAVATISSHFDARQDSTARLWLDFARNFHERVAG
jgi:hypothetical protein